jgi:hypothetical protein
MVELLFLLGGVLLGIAFTMWVYRSKTSGTLKIIRDEDGEYMYVELKHGLSDIYGKKTVKFLVDDLSQK